MSVLESIIRELEAGHPLALVSVVGQDASSPRHAGALMLVDKKGIVDGTVGGGFLEAQAIAAGRAIAAGLGQARFLDVSLGGASAGGADMICGGSMRLFLEPLLPKSPTKVLFQRLRKAMATGEDMFCVVPVAAADQRRACRLGMGRWPLPGELSQIIRDRFKATKEAGGGLQPFTARTSDNLDFVIIPWVAPWRLVVAGGGHVSAATTRLAAVNGFSVTVVDNRPEFSDPARFPWADLTKCAPGYEDVYEGLNVGEKTFIAIMTHGHRHDRQVLAQALRTKAGYVGMIGSVRKCRMVLDALRDEDGFGDADLARVTVPIGLAIGAETPEEIAVSIVGQLIKVRAIRSGSARHLPPEGILQDMAGLL